MRVFNLIFILALGSGCTHFASSSHPPTKLASRIADADRIVPMDYFLRAINKERGDIKYEITGSRVKTIVRAVISGERLDMGVGIDPKWGLRFYKGTDFLDEITVQGCIFVYEGEQYDDGSTNILEKLETDLDERAKPLESELIEAQFKERAKPPAYR